MLKILRITVASVCILFATISPTSAEDRDRKAKAALALADPGQASDRERKAKAVLALADSKSEQFIVAPPPRAKKGCACGLGCPCVDGLAKIKESLVRVRRGKASGSGITVWSDGSQSVVVTAAHVVQADESGETKIRGGAHWHAAELLVVDSAADIAVILVAAELPACSVAAEDPEDGAAVVMIGCTSLYSKGRLAGRQKVDGFEQYLLECDTGPDDYSDGGDSGGGVFVNGRLAGVHCGKTGQGQAPYCASARTVRDVLGRCLKRDGSRTVLSRPTQAVPKTRTVDTGYDLWLVNGQYMWVPKGQRPVVSSCPNGRCPPPAWSR